jgi:hypothetical protein
MAKETITQRQYFETMYPDTEGFIEVRCLPSGEQFFSRDPDEIREFCREHAEQNLYHGIATRREPTDGTKQNCFEIPGLWVDADFSPPHPKGTTKAKFRGLLKEFPLKPSVYVNSGGGWYVFFLFKEPLKAGQEIEPYLRGLARHFEGDSNACDFSRILRIPQTWNRKYTPAPMVEVLRMNGSRYNLSDFDPFVIPEDEQQARSNRPGWVAEAFEGLNEGEGRNPLAAKLAGHWFRDGLTPPQVLAALIGWDVNNRPPLGEAELRKIVESVSRYHPETPERTDQEIKSEFILKCLESNEDGDADLFVKVHKDRFLFDHIQGRWYGWGGHYWKKDLQDEAAAGFKAVTEIYHREARRQLDLQAEAHRNGQDNVAKDCEARERALLQRIRQLQSARRKKDVLWLSTCGRGSLGIEGTEWDQNRWLFACANGIIDLKSGELRPGQPGDFIKTASRTKWSGLDTPTPLWEKFLVEVFNEDIELLEFLQRLLGCAMTGSSTEHVFPIFWGSGRNGKGTLLQTIAYVMGQAAGPVPAEMLLTQRHTKSSADASADIMRLRGKRLVWASETGQGRSVNPGRLKWLT